MMFPVPHFEWQVLRTVLRSRRPAPGSALRLIPSRRTKDGTFLDDLVRAGLLAASGDGGPFDRRYALTDLGKYAAEHGEYETTLDAIRKPVPEPNPPTPDRQDQPRSKRK